MAPSTTCAEAWLLCREDYKTDRARKSKSKGATIYSTVMWVLRWKVGILCFGFCVQGLFILSLFLQCLLNVRCISYPSRSTGPVYSSLNFFSFLGQMESWSHWRRDRGGFFLNASSLCWQKSGKLLTSLFFPLKLLGLRPPENLLHTLNLNDH